MESQHSHGTPYGTDVTPVSTSKEQTSYLYSHATDDDDPDLYWYPVPVADSSSEEGTEHQAYREYQYLWFQTTKACLFMSVESISTRSSKFNLIKDTNGNTVGGLQISCNKESEVLHEGTTVELIAIVKGWTTIFKDSESGFLDRPQAQVRLLYERPELLTKEEEEKEWHDITNRSSVKDEATEKDNSGSDKERRQDCYHVLWIERED
ncbi:uncharacterized protein FIESC28_00357 [Fusarium coffeatum]|uniref:Uncharacterized protein n=1 Tax=Fusarium coffeatum TaxID=231269 RepID=A0A366SDN1_9HYPO|nr:uncharacterized protein FIESC28_00357 [Fusarium coffeatum]RBR26776.1 hypothetical protein FIESC28_00357 [Fusarium coffeatum]